MSSSPHHRMHGHYRSSLSPTSSCTDDESEPSQHSQPNDLTTGGRSKHGNGGLGGRDNGTSGAGGHHGFPNYNSFYSSSHHPSSMGQGISWLSQSGGSVSGIGGGSGGGGGGSSPYVATNEYRIIEYRGARIAAFMSANRNPCEYLLCLPQAFELFLKHLVGGLHTVYTKLKRLDIVPIVCNVEQVRILRGIGAIQPGVNRCKLLSTKDFDVLYKDCTTASRPGRPPKRSPVAGMVSPGPPPIHATTPTHQGSMPYLGFPASGKKPRFADETDFGSDSMDMKQGNIANGNSANCAATAAAMLAANGYSALPFLQHFTANSNNSQQQQLVAAAAALGLPGLPSTRFPTTSPPPSGLPGLGSLANSSSGNHGANNSNGDLPGSDLPNPIAAYLWQLSQQQQNSVQQSQSSTNASSALNLSSRSATINGSDEIRSHGSDRASSNSLANNMDKLSVNTNKNNNAGNHRNNHSTNRMGDKNSTGPSDERGDESIDEDDDEDDESHHSSENSENPVSSTGFNGLSSAMRNISDANVSNNHTNNSSSSPTPPSQNSHIPIPIGSTTVSASSLASPITTHPNHSSSSIPQPEAHCLETLLRNIEGLLAIAAHNARQQQSQLHLQKAELKAELGAQVERERELKEQLEKQLNEEQKIRILYQRRFKKERKFRKKIEQDLEKLQQQREILRELQRQEQDHSNREHQLASIRSSKSPTPTKNVASPVISSPVVISNESVQEPMGEVTSE